MSRALRFLVIMFALLCGALPARAAQDVALERGAAITDPVALRELDRGRFGIAGMLLPERSANTPLTNGELFALPSMAAVRQAIDGEFDRYIARHKASLPNETIGVGDSFDFQLFDRALLYSADTRFVLAGIVNRMDRAYLDGASCGEIRLIYRLTRTNAPMTGTSAVSPRLPMTLNVVLKAKGGNAVDRNGTTITCSEIARRWLVAGELSLSGAELAEELQGGPLDLIDDQNIDRIETNLQIAAIRSGFASTGSVAVLLRSADWSRCGRCFDHRSGRADHPATPQRARPAQRQFAASNKPAARDFRTGNRRAVPIYGIAALRLQHDVERHRQPWRDGAGARHRRVGACQPVDQPYSRRSLRHRDRRDPSG